MSNWTEEQQEQYGQGNDGGYTPPKGSLGWAEQPAQPEPAPKGTLEWAEQTPPQPAPAKGTQEWTEQNAGNGEGKPAPATGTAQEAEDPAGVPAHNETAASGNNANDVMGYDRQIAALNEAASRLKPETEEERKKRERSERSKRIVAVVSDGLQALSNLLFTTRGAPNMYDHREASQLTPLQEKLEKLKAERQANADKYLQYSLKVGDLQNDRAKTLRELEEQQERMRLAREKAQREQEAHGWLAALQPDKLREQAGKATKAEQEGITATEEAKNAPELYKAKVDTEKARGEAARASATNSYASANEHNTNARGRFQWWDENGNMHYAKTQDEAITKARQHGTLDSVTVDTTDSTESDVVVRGKVNGKKNSKKTTSKKVFYPGIRKKPAAKPSGGKQGGKWASGLTI
ncbi:hypothetical protein [Prevotellamassilia timonensis]|uniref:hypothetical protein n=1 Tax=Prevotellamassilia timonensis TaxID=1852370 RepID=UPI003A91C529